MPLSAIKDNLYLENTHFPDMKLSPTYVPVHVNQVYASVNNNRLN